jgi:hypothetical protein
MLSRRPIAFDDLSDEVQGLGDFRGGIGFGRMVSAHALVLD